MWEIYTLVVPDQYFKTGFVIGRVRSEIIQRWSCWEWRVCRSKVRQRLMWKVMNWKHCSRNLPRHQNQRIVKLTKVMISLMMREVGFWWGFTFYTLFLIIVCFLKFSIFANSCVNWILYMSGNKWFDFDTVPSVICSNHVSDTLLHDLRVSHVCDNRLVITIAVFFMFSSEMELWWNKLFSVRIKFCLGVFILSKLASCAKQHLRIARRIMLCQVILLFINNKKWFGDHAGEICLHIFWQKP